jgi:alkylated DNA repair dioxygenase AlkB
MGMTSRDQWPAINTSWLNSAHSSSERTGWPEVLLAIKRLVEERANQPYNYVLCNLYKDGDDYIGWCCFITISAML